jgi:hypothetical protein
MRQKLTLESKIRERIVRGDIATFVYADFLDLSDRDQIGRVLRKMVKLNELARFGRGIYVRMRKSKITGNIVPELDLRSVAEQALKKFNIQIFPSTAEIKYNNRESTQVPTGWMIGVNKRVSRKITYRGCSINYERMYV